MGFGKGVDWPEASTATPAGIVLILEGRLEEGTGRSSSTAYTVYRCSSNQAGRQMIVTGTRKRAGRF